MSQKSKWKVVIDREGGTSYVDNLLNVHDPMQVNFIYAISNEEYPQEISKWV